LHHSRGTEASVGPSQVSILMQWLGEPQEERMVLSSFEAMDRMDRERKLDAEGTQQGLELIERLRADSSENKTHPIRGSLPGRPTSKTATAQSLPWFRKPSMGEAESRQFVMGLARDENATQKGDGLVENQVVSESSSDSEELYEEEEAASVCEMSFEALEEREEGKLNPASILEKLQQTATIRTIRPQGHQVVSPCSPHVCIIDLSFSLILQILVAREEDFKQCGWTYGQLSKRLSSDHIQNGAICFLSHSRNDGMAYLKPEPIAQETGDSKIAEGECSLEVPAEKHAKLGHSEDDKCIPNSTHHHQYHQQHQYHHHHNKRIGHTIYMDVLRIHCLISFD